MWWFEMTDKDKSSTYCGDGAQIERLADWLQLRESIQHNLVDNVEVSPEEGVRLVTAYASIRDPVIRQAVVNFIGELAKASDSPA